jgi:hypothetical protein
VCPLHVLTRRVCPIQESINKFFKQLKYYCLRESREWKVSVCAV